jgi:hypothetical protein
MIKVEAVCPYCKKQIVVEKNHFGVGEHAHPQPTRHSVLALLEELERGSERCSRQVSARNI